jgi:hypothetical protein
MTLTYATSEHGHILALAGNRLFARAYFQDFRNGWVIDFPGALDSLSDVKTENVKKVIERKATDGFYFPIKEAA